MGEGNLSSEIVDVRMGTLDLSIIFIYLIGIIVLGCWAGMRRKESEGSDYFLASRSLSWPVIGLALFATNISTIHLVSFAQNGYTSGLVYGNFEWMAGFTLVVLALFFAPFYLRSNVATLPDFMEKRYSRGSRDFLAILSIFSAVVVHIGFSLLTGAIVLEGTVLPAFIEQPLDADQLFYTRLYTVIGICAATALYTIVGGLLAVVLTESIQTVVLLVGSICITVIGYQMIGGWTELKDAVHPVNLSILRSNTDPTGITWYAVFLGYPVLGIWYWCTDQTIVQRVLGAKDENHARIGPLFAALIKVLPVFLFVLPGLICLGLIHTGKIPPLERLPDGSPNTEQTYTHMIKTLLSPGIRGVVIAAMLAALMSTVSGALNSIATLFSYDIYRRWRPGADDRHLIRVGRIATFVAMCIAILWTMGISAQNTTIYQALVDVLPVVAPPTAAVFTWGVFWRKASAPAALWTLIGGSLLGLGIYLVKALMLNGTLDTTAWPEWLSGFFLINGLFMAFLLFCVQSAGLVVMSLIWPHRHTPQSEALVWRTPWDALKPGKDTWRGLMDFRVASAAVVIGMIALYIAFTDWTPYNPVHGSITIDGQPVVGAQVLLDAEDDRFDTKLNTDLDGQFTFGTAQRAGGAPRGTEFQVRLVPHRDYLIRFGRKEGVPTTEILAWMPAGADVDERTEQKKRVFTIHRDGEQQVVDVGLKEDVRVVRATDIPSRYREFGTSGLTFEVADGVTEVEFPLE